LLPSRRGTGVAEVCLAGLEDLMLSLSDPHHADRALAARCASGDPAAQRALYMRVRAPIYAALWHVLRGRDSDVDDLAQETFVAVFRSLHTYRGDSALTSWCHVVATRVAWAHCARRRAATVGLDQVAEQRDEQPDAAAQLDAGLAMWKLCMVIDQLRPAHRTTFVLAVIDGLSLAEIGERTDASIPAVKTRLLRARRELARRAERDPQLREYLH
jgi:RNA polymerase sigma factor (sigma-70 family)